MTTARSTERRSASTDRAVTIFLPDLSGGGAERSLLTVAAEFSARGRDVDLVLGRRAGPLSAEVPPGLSVVDFGQTHLRSCLPPLVRHLRRRRPGCMIATMEHGVVLASVAAAVAATDTTVLLRLANTLSMTAARRWSVDRARMRLAGLAYRRARKVIAVSQGAADDLVANYGADPSRVEVVANPVVGPAMFELRDAAVDHPWFDTDGPPVVLGVGRLTRQKNFPLLIEAFRIVHEQRPVRLMILGEGEQRRELEALARRLGVAQDVALPGFDPNPFRFMGRAAAFVLSSDWEGLPGGLIQALACGTPVVSTDCPSGPREILQSGAHGRLVPTGNAAALARAIEATLDGGRPPVDPCSWEPYTVDAAMAAYERLVADALARPRRVGREPLRADGGNDLVTSREPVPVIERRP